MTRTRRQFFAGLFAAVPAVAVSTAPAPIEKPIDAYLVAQCPQCGSHMEIVTRRREMAHHGDPRVWSCGRCKRSWRIPQPRVDAAVVVPYESGIR
jgi:ribosomal protein L37AE/L43A